VWKLNPDSRIIEGSGENMDWIDALQYNRLYNEFGHGKNTLGIVEDWYSRNPKDPSVFLSDYFRKGAPRGGIKLLDDTTPIGTEAMPFYNQSTKVPSEYFTYY